MVLQGCAKIVYSICTWNGFPILPFCEFPIALHGFVHIQHIHITACLRSSMQVSKESQIHLVQASPNFGSGGSGYWSLLLAPTCPAKAHLHMLKALLGYSSWRCTSSTRLSRPLNAREKSDCSVVVSSLCQSMLVPSSCYRNPSDVKFWQNCGFWHSGVAGYWTGCWNPLTKPRNL